MIRFVHVWFLQQEAADFVNSISLMVEIEQKDANANPVLDIFSPSAWDFFVSETRPVEVVVIPSVFTNLQIC